MVGTTGAVDECPRVTVLESFALGDLASLRFEETARHVDRCEACQRALAALDDAEDELISGLRRLPPSEGAPPAIPDEVVAAAREAVGNATTSSISLDPGRAYSRRLVDGPVQLGRFELVEELGDGTFGYVFRARDPELDRDVAVKIGRASSLAGEEEVRQFLHEARAAARLKHPGIVAVHDCGRTEDGVCFLVSEFVEGPTMASTIGSDGFEPRRAAETVAELADALAYAHGHGIVHRDVKPSNVIIDDRGRPHLADFGLAKQLRTETAVTTEGRVMGTPAYMSPEQALGESSRIDGRSDVYSLGVVLYELLTGERPFHGGRRLVLLQVLEDEPRPPRGLRDTIPRDLETICLKAMAKSPGRRYATADEFAADLRRYLNGEPIAARPMGRGERLWRWCRRYPLAASLMVATVLGSAIGFAHLWQLSGWFVRETALDSVRMEADMLERINAYYSEEVVGRLDWETIDVTHEYAIIPGALPLPATFTIDAGERISAGTNGMQVRLYSDHPWRDDAGPRDDFERRALAELRDLARASPDGVPLENADLAYHEFTEVDGRSFVRYARAQIMQESCVKCHNADRRSPRRDWVEGEVGGVLSITRPLDRDEARTRAGLRGAFVLVAVVAGTLVALSLSLLLWGRRTRPGGAAIDHSST